MDRLTIDRVALVRKYLEYPQGWPDGIDWGSHWYRNNKAYWDGLAREPVTETPVTKSPVTKTKIVTKSPKTVDNVTEVVARLGRPKKDKTQSAAERARAYRERRRQ